MPEVAMRVRLEATGVPATEARGTFDVFTFPQRIRRSAVIMLTAMLLAAMLLPIPIVHLVGPPMLLLLGIITSVRALSFVGRLSPVRVKCPKCGASNRLGGGLGYRTMEPRERMCDSCRRGLTLRMIPIDDSQVPGEAGRTS